MKVANIRLRVGKNFQLNFTLIVIARRFDLHDLHNQKITNDKEIIHMMAFYTWLMKNHRHENTPLGELAEELHKHSHIITRGQGYKRSRAYVQILCKTSEHLDAFEEAWKGYTAYKSECRHA